MTALSNTAAPGRTAAGICHCEQELTGCVTCGDPRCLRCDPYRSDDCDDAGTDEPAP
jgi:hypothetical protein